MQYDMRLARDMGGLKYETINQPKTHSPETSEV